MKFSAGWLLLSSAVLLLAQDSNAEPATVACWHHYCSYKEVLTCQRPQFYCGRNTQNIHLCLKASADTAEPPDMYCTSSQLMVCGCGHRKGKYNLGFTTYDVQEAFCDCQLSEVGKLILICVLVPLFVIAITVCFVAVCRRGLSSVVGNVVNTKSEKQQDIALKKTSGNVEDA